MAFKETIKDIIKPNDYFGWVGDTEKTKKIDIILSPNKEKGMVIDCLLIGGVIAFAVGRLAKRSYLRGANAYMNTEYKALDELGVFKD